MRRYHNDVVKDILYSVIYFTLGVVVACFYYPHLPKLGIVSYFFGPIYIIPISVSIGFINRLSDKFDTIQDDLRGTERDRLKAYIKPITRLLYGYMIFFLFSAIFTAWAFLEFDKPYAQYTIPASLGLAMCALRFLFSILIHTNKLNEEANRLKTLSLKSKRIRQMEDDLT